jgi:predicted DNA binding CopG/RHH family protein
LNIDPPDDKWLNGCPTVTVTCIHCKKWNIFKRNRRFFLTDQYLDSTFNTSKRDAIYKITIEVKHLWHEVGVALGLEEEKLKAIEQRCSDDSLRYQELLKEWIESWNGANWKKLLCAFRSSNVQAVPLSNKVERSEDVQMLLYSILSLCIAVCMR